MLKLSFREIQTACGGELLRVSSPATTFIEEVTSDSRTKGKNTLFFALSGERFDGHNFLQDAVANGAVLLCIRKDCAEKCPDGVPALLVEDVLKAYQALAEYTLTKLPGLKKAALTGSCGKTSTKEMIRAIFEHEYGAEHVLATLGNTNNQIGVPQNVFRLTPAHRVAVFEMGTNHPGEIEPLAKIVRPDSAMIVSIGACHLEFLGSLEGVAREKSHIFSFFSGGTAVIPEKCAGQEILCKAAANAEQILTFGSDPHARIRAIYSGGTLDGSSFELEDTVTGEKVKVNWSLSGAHQANNAAGAAALARSFGISMQSIAQGLANTTLPGLRMKRQVHNGAVWLNDAYNANPDSMGAALGWLHDFADPAHLLLVLGDMGEIGKNSLNAHIGLLNYALDNFPGVRIAAVGTKMSQAKEMLELTAPIKNLFSFPSAAEATESIRKMAKPGDLVFLKASRSTGLEVIEPEA